MTVVRQFTDGFAEEVHGLRVASDNLLGIPRVVNVSGFVNLGELTYCHPDASPITVSLPFAISQDVGRVLVVKHNSDSANDITVAARGSDLIDGVSTKTVTARGRMILVVLKQGAWGVVG